VFLEEEFEQSDAQINFNTNVNSIVKSEDKEDKDRFKGIAICIISKVFLVTCIILVKFSYIHNEEISGFDYSLFRGVIGIFIGMIEILFTRTPIYIIPSEIRWAIIFRFLAGLIGWPCYFIALKYLAPSQCHIII